MKRLFYLFALAASVLVSACQKENQGGNGGGDSSKPHFELKEEVTAFSGEGGEFTINYEIVNSIDNDALVVDAYAVDEWVEVTMVTKEKVVIKMEYNNSGAERTTQLTLNYANADPFVIDIVQSVPEKFSLSIETSSAFVKSYSFHCTVSPSSMTTGYLVVLVDEASVELLKDKATAENFANEYIEDYKKQIANMPAYSLYDLLLKGVQEHTYHPLTPGKGYGIAAFGVSKEGYLISDVAVSEVVKTKSFDNRYPDLTFTFENIPSMNAEFAFGVKITPSKDDVLWYAMYLKKSEIQGKSEEEIAIMALNKAYVVTDQPLWDGSSMTDAEPSYRDYFTRKGEYSLPSTNFYLTEPSDPRCLEKGVEYVAVAFAIDGAGDRLSPVIVSEETFASNQ